MISARRVRTADQRSLDATDVLVTLSTARTARYNPAIAMATMETPAQIKAKFVRLMDPQPGEAFAELMQDAARLHLKWNEFLQLYAVSAAQIDTLNKAAPGFFFLVSEAWWDGLILHIFRMTDGDRRVLSLRHSQEASAGGGSNCLRTEAEIRSVRLTIRPRPAPRRHRTP